MGIPISTIAYTAFFAVTGLFGLMAALSIYIYIRYGRAPTFTLASSAVFAVLFVIGVISALVSLQNLISLYV